MIDSANCPLCCILLFPLQQVCVTHSVLSPRSVVKYCTCCSSCFPYVSKKAQQGRLLFLKKLPQKLFFVVSLAAGLSESQVVIRCTCCSSCFPYISKKTQQGRAVFPEKAAAKSCSLLFPFQQDVWVLRLLYVILVVLVVFPISARRPSIKYWRIG